MEKKKSSICIILTDIFLADRACVSDGQNHCGFLVYLLLTLHAAVLFLTHMKSTLVCL